MIDNESAGYDNRDAHPPRDIHMTRELAEMSESVIAEHMQTGNYGEALRLCELTVRSIYTDETTEEDAEHFEKVAARLEQTGVAAWLQMPGEERRERFSGFVHNAVGKQRRQAANN